MDVNQLKELLADSCQETLDDLDEVEVTKKGLLLSFMSGDQFRLVIEDLTNEDDDDGDDEDDDDAGDGDDDS